MKLDQLFNIEILLTKIDHHRDRPRLNSIIDGSRNYLSQYSTAGHIKAALFTNGKSSKRIMARLSPLPCQLVIWVIEWACTREPSARVERLARYITSTYITRIDVGGAPRNTGCCCSTTSIVRLVFSRGLDFLI